MKNKKSLCQSMISSLVNSYWGKVDKIKSAKSDLIAKKLIEENLLTEKRILSLYPKNIEELLIKVEFVKKILKQFNKEKDILNKLILSVFDDINLLLKGFKE